MKHPCPQDAHNLAVKQIGTIPYAPRKSKPATVGIQNRPLGIKTGQHPIIRGLLARLPKSGDVSPEAERKLWLELLSGSFKLIYKDVPEQRRIPGIIRREPQPVEPEDDKL